MHKSIFQLILSVLIILTSCNHEVSGRKGNPNTNEWQSLFNGKNLDGWIDVNTSNETWHVKDGMIICSGNPIGVMRSNKQYENFIMEIEWRHMEAGGNSGVFIWSEGAPFKDRKLAKGIEVQMLELDWAIQNNRTDDYVHGELFPTMDFLLHYHQGWHKNLLLKIQMHLCFVKIIKGTIMVCLPVSSTGNE